MAKRPLPTPDELRQLLRYDPDTGKIFWLRRVGTSQHGRIWNSRFAGKEAFICQNRTGHLTGRIHGTLFLAHRVIWALVHGRWPVGQIDHINGNSSDNRVENLRDVAPIDNQRNMKRRSDNVSGISGVFWVASRGVWRAQIGYNGRKIALGSYSGFEDAVAARNKALVDYGYHPNHGRD